MANFEAQNTVKQGKKRQKDKWYPFHACTDFCYVGQKNGFSVSRSLAKGQNPPSEPSQAIQTKKHFWGKNFFGGMRAKLFRSFG